MEYKIIAEELIKNGFLKNNYGSPEKTIGNINISFVEHPFYHIVMYSRKSENGRTLHVPSDIKLPKKCEVDDVVFVIDSLVQGMDENEIVLEIYNRLNPVEEKGVNSQAERTELGRILREMYDNAPQGYKVANIHLFGIKYALIIRKNNFNVKDIVSASGLKPSYVTEINNGIKLFEYVIPK